MTAKRQLINLNSARDSFDLPPDLTYLNTAGLGPRLHAVSRAGTSAMSVSARPWVPAPDDWLVQTEKLRKLAATVLGFSANALAYTPSVSYAMALAEKNCPVRKGENVVVLKGEYPSNRAIWQEAARREGAEIHMAAPEKGECWTDAVLREISEDTAVVSVPYCHWADGARLDLEKISNAARYCGAALIVDASQSLGVLSMDVSKIQADFVIAPGHKWLLGAYGLGWLWVAEKHCKNGQPLEQTILARDATGDFASMGSDLPSYRTGARRFDFGPYPHPISIPMSTVALEQIKAWSIFAIRSRLEELAIVFRNEVERRGLGDGLTHGAAPHILAWRAPDSAALDNAANTLAAERVIVARRGGALRMTPHLHISESQIIRVVQLLASAV